MTGAVVAVLGLDAILFVQLAAVVIARLHREATAPRVRTFHGVPCLILRHRFGARHIGAYPASWATLLATAVRE